MRNVQPPRSALTRRGFLARAAGIAVAPQIVTFPLLGAAAPSNRIAVGMIGVGSRGRQHIIELFRNHKERARVVAVCDVNRANCDEATKMLAEMYKEDSCATHEDYGELLARDDIEAVIIAVPDHWHALTAVAAAQAGKPLYSEKPLAYTVAEGQAMVEAVKRFGVAFQHGTQQRSGRDFRFACELARNGRLGRVHTVHVGAPFGKQGGSTETAPVPDGLNYEFWLGPSPQVPYTPGRCDGRGGEGWYHIRDYSGGWVTAWGSHDYDIAQWGLGTDDTGPVTVEGEGEFATDGAYDTAWRWRVACAYADGRKIIFASKDVNPHGVKFEGDDGWVFVNRWTLEAEPESLLKEQFGPEETHLPVSDNHMGNFLDAVRGTATCIAPVEAAHRSTTACHLCNIAIALRRGLRWDPTEERFVDDDEANRLLSRPMRPPWRL
ncbi:MAG: Gfo/Idh/MocA family oxidoreductase [Candidatus Hydrogenedentes bacterium]|nr:Gfo/Idh/MocA family oxidoreductase [Candidatus Hydrogenedentota bacterium]